MVEKAGGEKMAEEKRGSLEDLLKQIEDFEKTIQELAKNVAGLKQKLLANREKFGPDIGQWPAEAK
jgi:archaellum component FlaC